MIKKSTFVVASALAIAVGVAGLAFATAADVNNAAFQGEVSPSKLSDEDFKYVGLFLGVTNQEEVTPAHSDADNPSAEIIHIDKSIQARKYIAKTPECPATPPNGATPEQAKATCPAGAYLGSGTASVEFPPPTGVINDIQVTVFHGPTGAQPARKATPSSVPVILHTYSPTLQTGSPTVQTFIQKSTAGKKYGDMLNVPHSPTTGSGLITSFNAQLEKSFKIVKARCDHDKFLFLRHTTYGDGSTGDVSLKQKCKVKGGK